jgi:hypothetical protein
MPKTDLIKARVTPELKQQVQRLADFEQTSVSALIEEGLKYVLKGRMSMAKTAESISCVPSVTWSAHPEFTPVLSASTSLKSRVTDTPERRTANCAHARPHYVYCKECDS